EAGRTATVAYVEIAADGSSVAYALAGHPPPLVIPREGDAHFLDGNHGVPLGVLPENVYEEETCDLAAGSTLFLYTDGLIEQGRPGYDAGLSSLAERIDSASRRPTQLVQRIEDELKTEELEDDVALLAFALS
ncbi:MAG: serine/threonine-protein phosphatase, partial [Actinomycetota bacterium]|nr:serine/threonine-protein phosphatase [Actinomycetota bacterium]